MLKITGIGYLGQDASTQKTNNGEMHKTSVAISDSYKNSEGVKVDFTTWIELILSEKQKGVLPYLKKGTQVYFEGSMKINQWGDNKEKYSIQCNVRMIELLGASKEIVKP